MWITPRNYPGSCLFAQATEASKEVLNECWEKSESSLMWRSKPSQLRTWLIRWKRDRWFRRLCGRILKPSLWPLFETMLTSSLAVIPANHSRQQGNGSDQKTPATSGPISFVSLTGCDPECASLRTLKGIYPKGCDESCPTWKAEVTRQRGGYSARKKSALRTREKECLSWPTASVCGNHNCKGASKNSGNGLSTEVKNWPTARTITGGAESGKRKKELGRTASGGGDLQAAAKKWGTPRVTTNNGCPSPQCTGKGSRLEDQVVDGPPAPEKSSTNGKSRESWPTPTCPGTQSIGAVSEWGGGKNPMRTDPKNHTAKLNPSWVESLMGLETNWTQLSTAQSPTENRIDRLRLLGNGVVPQTAEKAFRVLSEQLFDLPPCLR